MRFRRRAGICALSFMFAVLAAAPAPAAERGFPYDREMRLDAAPQRGSKRLPQLMIAENGTAEIDLWCVSGRGQAAVAEGTITIVPVAMRDNQCSEDQLRRDEGLLAELAEVTAWRREGNIVVLTGPTTLRFRMNTN